MSEANPTEDETWTGSQVVPAEQVPAHVMSDRGQVQEFANPAAAERPPFDREKVQEIINERSARGAALTEVELAAIDEDLKAAGKRALNRAEVAQLEKWALDPLGAGTGFSRYVAQEEDSADIYTLTLWPSSFTSSEGRTWRLDFGEVVSRGPAGLVGPKDPVLWPEDLLRAGSPGMMDATMSEPQDIGDLGARVLKLERLRGADVENRNTAVAELTARLDDMIIKLGNPGGYDRQIERAESRLSDRIDKINEKLDLIVDRVTLLERLATMVAPVEASPVKVEGNVS